MMLFSAKYIFCTVLLTKLYFCDTLPYLCFYEGSMHKIPFSHKNLSIQEMFDLICYNLAQYNHVYQTDYSPFENISTLSEYIDFYTNELQKQAKEVYEYMSKITTMLNATENETQKKLMEARIGEIQTVLSYNPLKVSQNKGYAKQLVKDTIPLKSFKVVYTPQHKSANSWDSFGSFNLFGSSNIVSPEVKTKFTPYFTMPKSFGPIFDNYTVGEKASQESIGLFLSRQTPSKPVFQQIWVNQDIMIQSNFKTKQSLDEYLDNHPHLMEDIFFYVAYAEDIYKRMGENRSQKFIDEQMDKERLEFLKRENEKLLEQYLLLTIELFCKLVYQIKEKHFLNTSSHIFNNINKIPTIKSAFSDADIAKMKNYLEIRNAIAHPTMYNLRPLTLKDVKDFVPTMVQYMANLLYMDEKDISKKIKTHKNKEIGSVRFLILMADAAKTLRKICIEKSSLPYNTPDPFVKLGFITKEQDETITKGILLRNDLCHFKIDQNMAKEANALKEDLADAITTIANEVEEKFHITLQDYFFNTPKNKSTPVEDFNRLFPGVLLNFDNEKKIIQSAFQTNGKKTQEDKETLLRLYCLACTVNAIMFENEPLYNNPFYEKDDLLPFVREVNTQFRKKSKLETNNRAFIFQVIVDKFKQDKLLPKQKKQHSKV